MRNSLFKIGVLALALLLPAASRAEASTGAAPDAARQAVLVNMVREDCGSCHGLTLKGGLGPALLPDALKGKDAASLQLTILYGRAGTPMPPWNRFLSDTEASWIVEKLLQGFPDAH